MVSIAQLAQLRRKVIQDVVIRFSIPIFRLLPDGEPDFWCSGFFLPFGDRIVLVSAAHGLAEQPPALILPNGAVTSLANDVVRGTATLSYPDPINDIGTVLLSRREATALKSDEIVPLSCVAPFEHRTPAAAYVTMGYHEPGQVADHARAAYYHEVASLMASPAADRYHTVTRLPASQALLLGASPASFQGRKGRGGVPKFRGMSGSPVWRFNPREDYSRQNVPPLVGMFVGQPQHTRKAITCIRVGVILEHVVAAYPELGSYVPRFT